MIPNLLEATQEYWQKLDELETAYYKGEISIEEVDRQVEFLMKELGRKRRSSITYFVQSLRYWFNQQKELVLGLLIFGVLFYSWLIV